MTQLYTTTDLIAKVKRRGMIPTSQSTFTDDDILDEATDEIWLGIVPALMRAREEFYVTYEDTAVTANEKFIKIPKRAVAGGLRDVLHSPVNPIGLRSEIVSLPRIERDIIPWRQNTPISFTDFLFAVRGNSVELVPPPRSTRGTIRLEYHRRPSKLVKVNATGKITNIAGSVVTVDNFPATFTAAKLYDFVKADAHYEFQVEDQTSVDSVSVASVDSGASTLTFSSAPPSVVAVGDYVALEGETCVPTIPVEFRPILALRTASVILNALGDNAGWQRVNAKLQEYQDNSMDITDPRVRGEARKISAPNYYKGYFWGG